MPITIGVALSFPNKRAQRTSKITPTARQARTRCVVDIEFLFYTCSGEVDNK